MKPPWWLWLVGCGALVGLGWMAASMVHTARAARVWEADDRAHAISDHTRDSLRVVNEEIQARASADSAARVRAERRVVETSNATRRVQDSLRSARSAADSLRIYPPLVASLEAERDAALVSRGTYAEALDTQLEANALLRQRIVVDSTEINRLRALRHTDPVKAPRKGSSIVRVVETLAIGAATVQACHSPLSLGCIAGGVVTLARLK